MTMKSLVIFVSLFYFFQLSCGKRGPIDFYWRDYTGTIPKDAVPGGADINNKTTYIGQGFVKDRGIIPGYIYPGIESMAVSSKGSVVIQNFVKILCSPYLHAFKWASATQKDLHTQMIGKFPVPGGFQESNVLYIGRTSYQGSVVIGKVLTEADSPEGKSPMYFVYKGKQFKRDSYQVLVYANNVK